MQITMDLSGKTYPVADLMIESLNHIHYLSKKINDKHMAAMEDWFCADCVRKATERAVIKEVSFMEAAFNAGKSGDYESFGEFHDKFMQRDTEKVMPKKKPIKKANGK